MNFVDRLEIAGTKRRADGALLVDARVARTGIQLYSGIEVGKPELAVVRVNRDENEVFHNDSLKSYTHRPVTNDHPPELVTSDNWAKYAVGGTVDEVARDGQFVRVPLMVSDGPTIQDIEQGKRQLSNGYTCDLDWTPGTNDKGETFDASQRNIRTNHIAVVQSGRAGSQVRIGDSAAIWGVSPIGETKMAIKMIVLADGLPIEATDQSEAVIRRLEKGVADAVIKITSLTDGHTATVAAKDKEIGTLTADLATAKTAIPTGAALTKLVNDRVALMGMCAKLIKDFKPETIADATDAAIRRGVVVAHMGEAACKDASDDKISGMFDALSRSTATTAAPDPVRVALQAAPVNDAGNPNLVRDNAYRDMVKRQTEAWKPTGAAN